MKERDFQNWLLDVAQRTGWRVWHVPAPMKKGRGGDWVPAKEAAGLPDLIMLHSDPPTLIFAELKGTGGSPTLPQLEFLRMAKAVGDFFDIEGDDRAASLLQEHVRRVGAFLWSPGHEEFIETVLKTRILA